MLQAVYKNPMSILVFQDTQTEEMYMEIGLRQGCVLSPLIFALYIADLAHALEASGLGVRINDVTIGAMLFADDIMLAGDKKQLHQLLQIILSYSEKNKMEFSSEKSIVIPLSRNPCTNQNDTSWDIQVHPYPGGLGLYTAAEEVSQGKYLGMTFQKGYNQHMEHLSLVLGKARKYVGLVSHLMRHVNNPNYLLQRIWNTYVIPALLYGGDILQVTKNSWQIWKSFVKVSCEEHSNCQRMLQMRPYTYCRTYSS